MTQHRFAAMGRTVLGLVVAIAALIVPWTTTETAAHAGIRKAEPASDGMSQLADCSAGTGQLAVVFLVDESLSLRRTDTDDRRVEGIQAALAGLAQLADRTADSDRPISVEVSMVGFGVDATEVVGWRPLHGESLPGLISASAQFADRDDQIDTDYTAALLAAQDQLAQVSGGQDSTPPCTAVLWFTDGEYDIEPRSTGERKDYAPDIAIESPEHAVLLEEHGKHLLCQPGGIVDGLRLGRTQLLAVALSTEIDAADQKFLKAVAEGPGGPGSCGVARPPEAPLPGAYVAADDLTSLIGAFFQMANEMGSGTPIAPGTDIPVCPIDGCETGTHRFTVDAGIRSFNLLALTSVDGIDVELQSAERNTETLVIAPGERNGEAAVGAADVRWTWVAEDAVLIDVTLPAQKGKWNGKWAVTFVDREGKAPGAVADAHIYVFGDFEPYVEVGDLHAGDDNPIRVGVRHPAGTPVSDDLFDDLVLEATVVDPVDGTRERLKLRPGPDGMAEGNWTAPKTDVPASVNISATAQVVTASGQALTPVTRTVAARVLPPASYPSLSRTDIAFPTVTGDDTVEALLTVRGGRDATGCVWFENAKVLQSPGESGRFELTTEPTATDKASCIRVGAEEERDIRVRLTPDEAANGTAAGTVQAVLSTDVGSDVVRTSLAWRAPLQKPLDTAVRNQVLAGLLLAGLLGPLVLMAVANALTGKFRGLSELRYAVVDVTVDADGNVTRTGHDGPDLRLEPKRIDAPDKSKELTAGPLELERRLRLWPLRAPYGEASAAGYMVGAVTGQSPVIERATDRVEVPFGLDGTTVVLLRPNALPATGDADRRPDIDATLVVFAKVAVLSNHLDAHGDQHWRSIAKLAGQLWERRPATPAASTGPEAEGGPSTPASDDVGRPPGRSSPPGRTTPTDGASGARTTPPPGRTGRFPMPASEIGEGSSKQPPGRGTY